MKLTVYSISEHHIFQYVINGIFPLIWHLCILYSDYNAVAALETDRYSVNLTVWVRNVIVHGSNRLSAKELYSVCSFKSLSNTTPVWIEKLQVETG